MSPPNLHNPYEGCEEGWQLHEPIPDFLRRLPPLTTSVDDIGAWIWASNPYRDTREQLGRSDIVTLKKQGDELLQQSLQNRHMIEEQNMGQPGRAITQLLNQEGERLKQQIADLAVETNVLTGKVCCHSCFPK